MEQLDTLVIGAGPGGYVAAIRAAQLGQNVTIVEREYLGGVCSNVGCIPSKALISVGHRFMEMKNAESMGVTTSDVTLNFSKVQSFKNGIVKKLTNGIQGLLKANNVEVIKGEAYFVNANTVRIQDGEQTQHYTFKNVILATGSLPVELPTFKFTNRVLNSTGALNLTELPKKLVVIGGGYIGTELGSAYANLGAEVTIIEGGQDILTGFEKQMTQVVKKGLKKKDVAIAVNALAKGVEEHASGVIVTYEVDGAEKKVEADYVFVTVGRRPNTDELGLKQIGIAFAEHGLINVDQQGRTNIPNIYAIGDIVAGPQLAHKASYEGKVVAEAIAGEESIIDYLVIPAVCFTDPELATVGLSEEQAIVEGLEVKVTKFPFAVNGRALAMNTAEGFVKLITRKEDGLLLGAGIVGVSASNMIAELSLAIESGMTAAEIALTVHAHPTLGEVVMDAAEAVIGRAIHVVSK